MPKVMRAVEALREGDRLVVAGDSAWPTTMCTPSHVQQLHNHYPPHVGLWLGAARGCTGYRTWLGPENFSVKRDAPAGSKLFSGTASFWRRVDECFLKLHKDYSTDCIFQFLTGTGLVSVINPFLAISAEHWSDRAQSLEERSYLDGECKRKLRPMEMYGTLVE